MTGDDFGAGLDVGRGHFVADLFGDEAAVGMLVLVRLALGAIERNDDETRFEPDSST